MTQLDLLTGVVKMFIICGQVIHIYYTWHLQTLSGINISPLMPKAKYKSRYFYLF